MFFQNVTLSHPKSAIMLIGLLVEAQGFVPIFLPSAMKWRGAGGEDLLPCTLTITNRCKCDKNRLVATATLTTFATF